MKGLNRIFLCLFFLICADNLSAQSPATGCLLSNNIVYTNDWTTGSSYYRTSDFNTLPANRCSWNPSTGGSVCYVSASRTFDVFGCFCYVYASPQVGRLGTFTAVACPLDDYIPLLILASGGFGLIVLRKRNLLSVG